MTLVLKTFLKLFSSELFFNSAVYDSRGAEVKEMLKITVM
jgi:hypothetical protein